MSENISSAEDMNSLVIVMSALGSDIRNKM